MNALPIKAPARRLLPLLRSALMAAALSAMSLLASGAETIRLIAVDSYSASSLWVKVFIDYFIPEVDRRLALSGNYQIDWNPAFGGTIAKTRGVLDSVQHDLADIGIVTTPYHADKVPFFNLPFVTPMVTDDVGLVARTMSELSRKYPQIWGAWADYRAVYLTTAGSIDAYNLLLAFPFEDSRDLQGTKIGGVGLNLLYLEGTGAAGVTSGLSDWYNNMATGLLDGILVWPEAVVSYKLYEVAPYMLDIKLGAVTSKAIIVNERTWNRLPEEVTGILSEVAEDYRDELARETDRISGLARRTFVEEGGAILPVSSEMREAWAQGLPNLALDWVEDMESRGLPGRQILSDYMGIMRANEQPIIRHWDLELDNAHSP